MSKQIYYYNQLTKDNKDDMIAAGWNGQGWYFWDETQAYCYGPFETEKKAEQALINYAETL